jgi:hypothetical protein
MPDPGKYDVPPSIGRQTLSTKESASPKSFVKATRNVKVSIGKGFEEDMYGLDAPGPGTYSSKSGFGTQARDLTAHFVTLRWVWRGVVKGRGQWSCPRLAV